MDHGTRPADRLTPPSVRRPAAFAAAVLLVGGLARWVVEPVRITSDSMEPTLAAGSAVVVEKLSDAWREVRPGDVVVIDASVAGHDVVKRVVATAGQTIGIEDGQLVVDAIVVEETYLGEDDEGLYFGPVEVPPEHVFVLGDRRRSSTDSRAFGPVPVDALVGRVVWP